MSDRGLLAIVLAVAGLLACGDAKQAKPADPARTAEDVFAELAAAGMATAGAAPVDGATLGGGACTKGTVAALEVTICRHPDDGAAKAAQPTALASIGGVTGAALVHGRLLLVVHDRGRVDPSGKKIDQLTKIFLGKPAAATR